jgi:hypothetical protein
MVTLKVVQGQRVHLERRLVELLFQPGIAGVAERGRLMAQLNRRATLSVIASPADGDPVEPVAPRRST